MLLEMKMLRSIDPQVKEMEVSLDKSAPIIGIYLPQNVISLIKLYEFLHQFEYSAMN